MKKLCASICVILFINSSLIAQFSKEFSDYKLKYPDENQIELNNLNVLNISVKNGELLITEDNSSEKLYLNSNAKYQSKESIVYSTFFSIDKIEASAFNFINGKYKEFKVTEFKEKDEFGKVAFYDDKKSKNFFYSGLETGSKTKLSYRTTIKNPRFLGSYYFGDYSPIENFDLQITADKNVVMDFKYVNADTANIIFTQTSKGNKNIYHWSLKNIDSYNYDNQAVNFKYFIPHIIPVVKYYYNNNDTTFVLNSTKDLYLWYSSLTKDVNTEPCDKEIISLVDSLTKNLETDIEKVKAIYYWTQQNIKYVAFENGLGGFVPRNANDIYSKKYGDCKDNSSILQQMLKLANIKGHLTWIGTRDIPYSYDQIHSPSVDNHMILTYFDNDKPYFLDATGRFLNLDLPSSFIQGKESLIGIDEKNYKIVQVPIVDGAVNLIRDSMSIKLDSNNLIIGAGIRTYTGYEKSNFFNSLERITTKNDLEEYYKNVLEKGSNNFLLDTVYEENKYKYDMNFLVHYQFNLKNYVREIDNKIYINLNFNPEDVNAIKNDKPFKNIKEYTHKFMGAYHTELSIPEGYEIDFLPSNVNYENDLCTLTINYEVKDNKVYYNHTIKSNFLTLNPKQQEELNELIQKAQRNFKEVVVLKKKTK